MRRSAAGLAIAIAAAVAAPASAQPAPATTQPAPATAPAPAVDVEDLPPLPPGGDEPSGAATVLAASAAEEEVVVGAAKREQSLGNVASAVTVISGDRLRRFGYRTIGEAVAGVAGAYLVDNRLSYSIGIRGLQIPGDYNTRILVLIDGASINEAWGAFAGLGFDGIVGIDEIARIEVIRGPVSSVYGTNAFFGIINIITRGAAETSRAWARATGQTINGVLTSAGFAAGGVDRQLRGAVHFGNRFGESGLPTLDGMIEPQSYGDHSRMLNAGLVGAYGGSFVQVRALRYVRESPFAPYDTPPDGPAYEQIDNQLLVEGGHARELSRRLSAAGRVFANLYRYSDSTPPVDPTLGYLDTTGTAQVIGAELRGRYELVRDRLGVTAGAEASYDRTRSTAVERGAPGDPIDLPHNFNVLGLYAELDGQPAPWLGVTGGLRFDHNSAFEDKLSPRTALFLARPERYGAKLLYAQGFRNPSAYEAFFDDGADYKQAEGLRAETIRSYEAVLWAKPRPGLSVRLSGFVWDARKIIEVNTFDDGGVTKLQFQNVTRYASQGGEAEASYRDRRGWYAFAGAAVVRIGTDDGAGGLAFGDVVNAPAVTASAGVSTPRLLGVAHLSTEAHLIGARSTRPDIGTGEPSPRSPAWLGWNVIAYAPKLKGFDVTLGVRNALGRRELIPTQEDYDRTVSETRTIPRVPGEGREAYVRVGYSY